MEKLTQRQVIGTFYKLLSAALGAEWINAITNYFTSDQAQEEYAWLGQSPAMREWIGGRNAKKLREEGFEIRNKHFEATIDILISHLRRDKSGQAMVRISEMARRANTHWASLLSTLLLNAASGLCYDGKAFFATDHEEGESGAQSNIVSVDISELPVAVEGSTTLPAVAQMQFAIAQAIARIVSFKDDQGEPMNEDAMSFLVMVPVSLMNVAFQATATPVQVAETQSALTALKKKFKIDVVANARLSSWTDTFSVFRTDANVKSFIRQEEKPVEVKTKWEDSEYAFDNDAVQVGIDSWRAVGYGYWQNSVKVVLG